MLLRAYLEKDPSGGDHRPVPGEGSISQHKGYTLSNGFYDGDSGLDQCKRHQQIYSLTFAHRFNDVWAFRTNASYSHATVDVDVDVDQTGWLAG
ncbi:hypothetical protein BL250_17570 [Erwinia sp. OLTSP20]|nr:MULTISPECIES: hypothetical protein [unclassified Erwinia]PIJ48059.1 hypothetical protein BV501_18390 [Erwinia sp. OAMSP11]PIJ66591.1 hypothetical protein BK416_17575 [Erwinia sp. OLSSP12]PIJ77818.1 hypothetical protein BLD47_17500 [Erwinia sp. OLCASP19]PIJ79101.1 hypothetical protein BLD46_17415 [Erwinia sp. OLMTSP26]PIJ79767.1 hypothetical protein BLD49_17385 [Erwinia sp. OLMDSP33]